MDQISTESPDSELPLRSYATDPAPGLVFHLTLPLQELGLGSSKSPIQFSSVCKIHAGFSILP